MLLFAEIFTSQILLALKHVGVSDVKPNVPPLQQLQNHTYSTNVVFDCNGDLLMRGEIE